MPPPRLNSTPAINDSDDGANLMIAMPLDNLVDDRQLITFLCSDRCDLRGQLGSPGCPYGHGPSGPCPLEQDHELQPKEPKVDQPRQIRAFVSIPCFLYSSI